MALVKNHPPFPEGSVCRWSYVNYEEGKAFCDWIAPSREVILDWFKAIDMPYDVLMPVRMVDWLAQTIEPAREVAAV